MEPLGGRRVGWQELQVDGIGVRTKDCTREAFPATPPMDLEKPPHASDDLHSPVGVCHFDPHGLLATLTSYRAPVRHTVTSLVIFESQVVAVGEYRVTLLGRAIPVLAPQVPIHGQAFASFTIPGEVHESSGLLCKSN